MLWLSVAFEASQTEVSLSVTSDVLSVLDFTIVLPISLTSKPLYKV